MAKITAAYLYSVFRLDLKTGRLFWKRPSKYHNEKIGLEAGCPSNDKKPYWIINLNSKKFKRGKLVFFMTRHRWPKPYVDHKNGNGLDDNLSNLRDATKEQNNWNRKSGKPGKKLPMGVRHAPQSNNFQARIGFRKLMIHIGTFTTVEAAHQAYLEKRKELYGDFA